MGVVCKDREGCFFTGLLLDPGAEEIGWYPFGYRLLKFVLLYVSILPVYIYKRNHVRKHGLHMF